MSRTNRKDLRQTIAIGEIAEQAESEWRKKQRNQQTLTQWLIWSVPFLIVIVFAVFYGISAPHTAGFLEMITPGMGAFAPIGFEFGLVVLAVLTEIENRKNRTTVRIMWVLLVVMVIINFAGATTNILFKITTSTDNASLARLAQSIREMTFPELISNFSILPAYEQVSLFLGFIVGPFTPFMTKFTGEYIVKLATGKIVLQSEKLEDIWLRERQRVLYQALFKAALQHGAGNQTAMKFALGIAESYFQSFDSEEDNMQEVDAIGQVQSLQGQYQVQPAMRQEFGFAGMVGTGRDNVDSLSKRPVAIENQGQNQIIHAQNREVLNVQPSKMSSMSQEMVIAWMQQTPHELNSVIEGVSGKRNRCKVIAEYLSGDDNGYKTVERAFAKMKIEL